MKKLMMKYWPFLLLAKLVYGAEEILDRETQIVYLARLGLNHGDGVGKADQALLDLLIKRHLVAIPFENLTMHMTPAAPVRVEHNVIIDKVLKKSQGQNRGGYCYEINELFYLLLKSLGFEVVRHKAAVWAGKEPGFIPNPTHQLATVVIDGKRYLADVGFGLFNIFGAVVLPQEVNEEVSFVDSQGKTIVIKRVMFNESFSDEQKNQQGYVYSRYSEKKQSLEMVSSFTLQSYQAADFYANNDYVQLNYKPFLDNIMFTRFTNQGHMIICVRPRQEFSDMAEIVQWINASQGACQGFSMSVMRQ